MEPPVSIEDRPCLRSDVVFLDVAQSYAKMLPGTWYAEHSPSLSSLVDEPLVETEHPL